MLTLTLLCLAALAQETEDRPLAIPATPGTTAPAPPRAVRPGIEGPPSDRPGAMSPQKLEALRRYRNERLQILGETEVHGGGATFVHGVWWGPRWGPATSVVIAPEPVFTSRTWGFYQGPERLDVPTALRLAGDERAERVQQTIDRKRRAARTWTGVAVASAGLGIAGVFGELQADTRYEYLNWRLVTLGGAVGVVTGLVVAAGPAGEAQALQRYPARSLSPAEARAVVDRHNDRLRQELGLSPQEVWSIEQSPPAVR